MSRFACPLNWKISAAAGLIMVLPWLASAQPVSVIQAPEEARALLEQGRQAVQQGDDAAAIGYFSAAIRSASRQQFDYAEAHLALGEIYLKQKQYGQAVQSFSAAIAEQEEQLDDEQTAKAHHGRGKAYLEGGDPNSAISDFNQAAAIDWDNVEYLLDQATTLTAGRAAEPAIKIATRILALEPQDAEQRAAAYDARGQAHGLLARQKPGALESAMSDFTKAIEISPNDKNFYHHAGMVLLQNERYAEAVGAFGKAIEVSAAEATAAGGPASPADAPTSDGAAAEDKEEERPFVEPYIGRALTLIELGKRLEAGEQRTRMLKQAAADAEAAIALYSLLPDAYLVLGVAHRFLEEYDQSVAALTAALKLNPEYSEALYRRGIVWYYVDEPGLAVVDLTQAAQIATDDARPSMWLGLVHAKTGDYHAAVMHYGAAIERDSRFTSAYENRGLAYLQLAQLDKAIRDFDEVIRIDPKSAAAYHARAAAYQMQGDLEQAAVSLEIALKLDPTLDVVRQGLAGLYRRLGQAEQAARVLREAETVPVAKDAAAPEPGTTPAIGPTGPVTELLPGPLTAPAPPAEGPLGITPGVEGSGPPGPIDLPAETPLLPGSTSPAQPQGVTPSPDSTESLLDQLFPNSPPSAAPTAP
jgi:tetratricopeptide (TPR) repeat protein